MNEETPMRYEFVNDDVFVLDSEAGVVHRLTGDSAESVRAARDEVSRRHAIKLSLATGVGVVTMMLPAAAAAASGGGVDGSGLGGDVLNAPTGVTVTSEGNTTVGLSWNAVSGASSYTINYRVSGSGGGYLSAPASPNTNGTVSGLDNGTTYEFTVTASAAGKTPATSTPSVTGTPTNAVPGTPGTFAGTATGTSVNLSWTKGTGGVPSNYVIRYGTAEPYSTSAGTISGGTTAVSISGLTKGQTYKFYLKATSASGESSETSVEVYVPNPPATPNNFVATKGILYGEAVLTWEEDLSEGTPTSYTIRWKESTAGSYSPSNTTTGLTGGTYTKTGLTGGTAYDFEVKAVNADGASDWVSSSATARNKPNAPTSLAASVSGTTATVTWSAPTGGGPVDTYTVRRKVAGETDAMYVTLSSVLDASTFSYAATGLSGGTTYVFEVTAVNTDGSAAATTSNVLVPNPPGAPTNVSAAASGTTASVSWSAPITGGAVTSYTVQYRLAGDSDTDANYNVASTNATSPLSVGPLVPGSSYVFRVIAVNDGGTASATSSSLAILNPPGNPINVTATGSNAQVVLAWTAPVTGGTVTSYTVVHGVVGGSMTTVTGISSSATSQTYTSLTNGSTYQYTITAVGADGSSSGVTVYAVPFTTNQVTMASAQTAGPISTLTTSPTAASLTVDSDGTNYEYELDGATAVSIAAGSTTSIALSADSHSLVVRKTFNGAEVEATATITKRTKTGSSSAVTTLYNPNTTNGVRSVSLTMVGGTGGSGGADATKTGGSPGKPGEVSGTFDIAAGDTLEYAVGGGGSTGSSNTSSGAGAAGTNPMSGYDGGTGGDAGSTPSSGAGGGGGAASVVKRSGAATKTFVAAGSGGGGGGAGDGNGGNGQAWSSSNKTANTSGGAGQRYSGDGAGSGGGGGGASGGNGGALVNLGGGAEAYGQGGYAGENATASEAGLTASAPSGTGTAGTAGTLTLVYYELTALAQTTSTQTSGASLDATTPVSGSAPSATVAIEALSGDTLVGVSWTAVTGATDYVVYYRRTGTSTWGLAGTSATTKLTVRGLRNGTTYDFAVRTRVGTKTSALSSTASATPAGLANPVTAATTSPTLATITLDNVTGSGYTYKVDSGAVTGVTGQSSFTAALSAASHTVVVTKSYFDGSDTAFLTQTITLTQTTTSSSANSSASYTVPSSVFGPRTMSVTLVGGGGGEGGSDSGRGGYSYDSGKVKGTLEVQAGDAVAVYAGSKGDNGANGRNTNGGGGGANAYSGYNGGPGGQSGGALFTTSGSGGGGGAASIVVRTRSGSDTVLAVAGGAGGGGGGGSYNSGGTFGDTVGHVLADYRGGMAGTDGGNGEDKSDFRNGGGGGGGGGGAAGGSGGTIYEYNGEQDVTGDAGYHGTNSVSGLATVTQNQYYLGNPNPATDVTGVDGTATLTYYTVAVA